DEIAFDILLNKESKRIKKDLDTNIKIDEIINQFRTNKLKLEKNNYRLAYRDVGGATNERTMIATIIPPNYYSVNTIIHLLNYQYSLKSGEIIQIKNDYGLISFLTAILNSLVINFYMRSKISSHSSMFKVYELPIPDVDENILKIINKKSFNLLYHFSEKELYEDLRKDLGFEIEKINPIKERAELEVIIAQKLFKLDKEDWEYLCSTFIYGGDSETKKELDRIIDHSKKIFKT
ncbi:MAG: hypothetical protein H8E57_05660, partial [Candidatus Cloacimonetes bacterium]|nr:hypothetical protein [Candidatus Cloacimonadota bacterium]